MLKRMSAEQIWDSMLTVTMPDVDHRKGGNKYKQRYDKMKERVNDEIEKVFRPEFLNRVDETLVFHRLTEPQLLEIVDIQVDEVINRVAEKDVTLILNDDAKDFIVRLGSDEEYGARPLRRAVQHYIEDPLAELLLTGKLSAGTKINVRPSDIEEKLVFEPVDTGTKDTLTPTAAEGIVT